MRGLETAPLTRHQCTVSDTQMAVMANGPLVFIFTYLITFPFFFHVDRLIATFFIVCQDVL